MKVASEYLRREKPERTRITLLPSFGEVIPYLLHDQKFPKNK